MYQANEKLRSIEWTGGCFYFNGESACPVRVEALSSAFIASRCQSVFDLEKPMRLRISYVNKGHLINWVYFGYFKIQFRLRQIRISFLWGSKKALEEWPFLRSFLPV